MHFSAWRIATLHASVRQIPACPRACPGSGRDDTGSESMATAARKTPATKARKTDAAALPTLKAPAPASFGKEQDLKAYRDMLLIRRFEVKAGQLYGMGFIGGFCHLYIGQEAVVTGMAMAIKDGDQMISAYRDHGHMLAMD